MGSSCLNSSGIVSCWIPASFTFCNWADKALEQQQQQQNLTAMPHLQQPLGNECKIFVSWQRLCSPKIK